MAKKSHPQNIPFINRIKETEFLNDFFKNRSSKILFIYGPKSTGKTTLLDRVIQSLDQEKYATSRISMRGVLIRDFKDFKNIFFHKTKIDKLRGILSGIKLNLGFFNVSVEDEEILNKNIFTVMEQQLIDANKKGIKPIIVIDEFQYLRDIMIDKENNLQLVEELWKFFIEMTKVKHLCHIVCATSDSYYMEELYNHTKLKNTSDFYLIEHLKKEDIQYRLGEKEKLDQEIVDYFRENLGGSVWEIRQSFVDLKNGYDYIESIQRRIQVEYGRIAELYNTGMSKEEREDFNTISKEISINGIYYIPLGKNFISLIKKLVDLDIRFYDPIMQTLTANSQSIRKAFERLY